MDEKRLEIRVGLLILGCLVLLVGFVLILGDFTVGKGYHFYAKFHYSGDIQTGASVRVSGVKVGRVEEVTFLEQGEVEAQTGKRLLIRLKIWVEERVRKLLRRDSDIYITARGVLGEKYVGIVPGSVTSPEIGPGNEVRGTDPPQTDLLAARLYDFLENLGNILKKDAELIRKLLHRAASVAASVDDILKENRPTVRQILLAGKATLDELKESIPGIVSRVRGTLSDARRFLATGQRVLGDGSSAKAVVTNVREITSHVRKTLPGLTEKVGGLLDEAREQAIRPVGELIAKVKGFVAKNEDKVADALGGVRDISNGARRVLRRVFTIVDRIAQGKGTIGALVKDDELYDNIREMLRDLKQHPWKVLWKD